MFNTKIKIQNPKRKAQRGISVLFVVLIMGIILSISLGVSSILSRQVESLRNIGYSVVAFYAADTGIEKILTADNPLSFHGYKKELESIGAEYSLTVKQGGQGNCSSTYYYCIKSIGVYQDVKRAIEINY